MENYRQKDLRFSDEPLSGKEIPLESSEKFKVEEIENINQVVIQETLQKQLESKLEHIDSEIEKNQQKLAKVLEEILKKE